MIDFTEYDMNRVKRIDMFLMLNAERMNQMEWSNNQPLWRKLLFCEKRIPNRFRCSICQFWRDKK